MLKNSVCEAVYVKACLKATPPTGVTASGAEMLLFGVPELLRDGL